MPEPVRCPECGVVTSPHAVTGLELDVCPGCGGIWFEPKELKEMLAEGAAALDELVRLEPAQVHPSQPQATLNCPRCGIVLHSSQLAAAQDVGVHTCYQCAGLYLEAADLAKLDAFFRNPGAPSTQRGMTAEEQQACGAVEQVQATRVAALERLWTHWCRYPGQSGDEMEVMGLGPLS